jgi:predicted ATPase
MEGTCLLTLTGTGGVGKTRLALKLAHEVRRNFTDGVWLVDLAELREGELLCQTVMTTLGLIDRSTRSPLDRLTEFLADKRLLLILDNCEHLLESCAELICGLLQTAPGR